MMKAMRYGGNVGNISQTTLADIAKYLSGQDPATQRMITRQIGDLFGSKAMRFARSNPIAKNVLRAVPGLSALGNVVDVADIVTAQDGVGNAAADAVGMGAGGAIGFLMGGPLGASVGAGIGKNATDIVQGVFKSPEQRKLEEALEKLNGGIL